MKAFRIGRDQIARVVAGVVADELGSRFKRYTDFLTQAGWTGDTPLGPEGVEMKDDERAACARGVARFFGVDPGSVAGKPAKTIADWATMIEAAVGDRLETFGFVPAGRDSETDLAVHAAAEAYRDAAAIANLLHGRRRMVSLVGAQGYLSFVATVLAPNLLKIASIEARGRRPDELAALLAFGDAVAATPTVWRHLVSEGARAPDNAVGVVFGEAFTPDLAAEMRKCGFGAVRELYGSSECGVVGWRDSPGEPFTLFDHWKRDGENLKRLSADGVERPFLSMDALEWRDDRNFRLGPRRDGAIQVGAVNVFPARIAEILKRHAAVRDCEIVVMRQANGLNRLVARIELKGDKNPNETTARDIDAWCRTQLRPQERPRIYNFVSSVSRD
jgi:4-coumarate--CoA ligase (photoactive yellow protein activation family)